MKKVLFMLLLTSSFSNSFAQKLFITDTMRAKKVNADTVKGKVFVGISEPDTALLIHKTGDETIGLSGGVKTFFNRTNFNDYLILNRKTGTEGGGLALLDKNNTNGYGVFLTSGGNLDFVNALNGGRTLSLSRGSTTGSFTNSVIFKTDSLNIQNDKYHGEEAFSITNGTGQKSFVLTADGAVKAKGEKFAPRKQVPIASFIFDDGFTSALTLVLPLFDAWGVKAAVAINTDTVGDPGMLTWAQIDTMKAHGWEIMSHSRSHQIYSYSTEAEVISQVRDCYDTLLAHRDTAYNFAYPGGVNNEMIRRVVKQYHRSARAIGQSPNPSVVNQFALNGIAFDNTSNLSAYKAAVDTALSQRTYVSFYGHDMSSAHILMLDTLIRYIKTKGISIVTPNDALDSVGNYVDNEEFAMGPTGVRMNSSVTFLKDLISQPNKEIGSISAQGKYASYSTNASYAKMKMSTDSAAWYLGQIELQTNKNDGTDPLTKPTTDLVIRGSSGGLVEVRNGLLVKDATGTGTRLATLDANGRLIRSSVDPSTLSTSSSSILNQTTQQTSSNYNISGSGTIGTTLQMGTATTGWNLTPSMLSGRYGTANAGRFRLHNYYGDAGGNLTLLTYNGLFNTTWSQDDASNPTVAMAFGRYSGNNSQIGWSYIPAGSTTATTTMSYFGSDGRLMQGKSTSDNDLYTMMSNVCHGIRAFSNSYVPVVARGFSSSQTANLQEWQASDGSVKASIGPNGKLSVDATNTATGTTGAQTIDKPSGIVNFSAGASTLVVTNARVVTTSLVFVQVLGSDATAISARVTRAVGSFTITLNAAATAETAVEFFVIN